MARECGVPYLGSVPIDTSFGELVEGVRLASSTTGDGDEKEGAGSTELVERYKDCGLCRIFNGYATMVVEAIRARGERS